MDQLKSFTGTSIGKAAATLCIGLPRMASLRLTGLCLGELGISPGLKQALSERSTLALAAAVIKAAPVSQALGLLPIGSLSQYVASLGLRTVGPSYCFQQPDLHPQINPDLRAKVADFRRSKPA